MGCEPARAWAVAWRVGGVVTAVDVAAGQADAQVQPLTARPQAILKPIDRWRQLAECDLVEVITVGVGQRAHSRVSMWGQMPFSDQRGRSEARRREDDLAQTSHDLSLLDRHG